MALVAIFLASSDCMAFSSVHHPLAGLKRLHITANRNRSTNLQERRKDFQTPKAWENFIKKERLPLDREVADERKNEEAKDPAKASWVGWMRTGSRGPSRGVSEVKLREAVELGGVPRSDRYSSG